MTYRLELIVAVAAVLLSPSQIAVQEALSPSKDGDAAHLFAYYPKAAMAERFDEGYRRHLEWHRQKRDPLIWYAWYVEHGRDTGKTIGLFRCTQMVLYAERAPGDFT